MDNYTQVIKRIVELRAQQGRTQEELASIIGLSRQRWILVEKGERPLSVGELEKIADFFNVPVASFFTELRNNEKFEQMYFRILRRIENKASETIVSGRFSQLLRHPRIYERRAIHSA